MTSMIRQERGDEQDAHAGMDENRGGPAGGVCHLQALSAWACGDRLATRNGSCRLIAVIQQRKANDIIRPHLPVVCRRGIVGYSPNNGPSAPTLDANSFAVLIVNQLKDSVLSFEEK